MATRPREQSFDNGSNRESGRPPRHGAVHRRGDSRPRRPVNPQPPPLPAAEAEADLLPARGVLELHPQGYGFLRDPAADFRPAKTDVFVPAFVVTENGLRPGNYVEGAARQTRKQEGPRFEQLHLIDGYSAAEYPRRDFESLTPVLPHEWYRLETGQQPVSTRAIDLLTPFGKGQRALVVSPPRAGKTILLQQIGHAIATNYPGVKLFVLLTDERPEEVTEMRRAIRGQVLASSLDRDVESHVRLAQLAVERCKRLAEIGHDVFLLIDSLTRIARAFNKYVGDSGRTMSGGVDIRAMDVPKRLFASARAFEEGGSLTIAATALIDTGSRMDELIFQEFKGTGNMELVLDRQLAERRVWPAIDISMSGTRREDRLLDPASLHAVTLLRRTLATMNPTDAMEHLTAQLGKFKSNRDFLEFLAGAWTRFG